MKGDLIHLIEGARKGDEEAWVELYKKYERFIYWIVKKFYDFNGVEVNEFVSVGFVGFTKAVYSYNFNENVRFTTYLHKVVCNEIMMFLRSQKKLNKLNCVSLDELNLEGEDGRLTSWSYFVGMDERADDLILLKDLIAKVLTKYNKLQRKIIMLRLKGYKGKDVVRIIGRSRSYVSKVFNNFKRDLVDLLSR